MRKVESKYQCIPFWSWNDELEPEELERQIQWMYDNGVGGFFMHARGGLKTEYLGEKWFRCVEACQKKAQELGMEAYAYDENGWPSGFAGGKLLEDIENHDRYLTHAIGAYDEKALVSYEMTGAGLRRTTKGENCLNVYEHYAASTADILNDEVVDKFIALTHEQYKKHDTLGNLRGFFTDEPQYYRWDTPYTKVLPKYFQEEYGEDILDGLGLLFVEEKGYRAFRYKYWKAMQALMLKNYAKKIYDWCDQNDYKLTGHYVEETMLATQMWCCGGVMPFYEYEHIPGIDWLGRGIGKNGIAPKQLGSVVAQLGKKQAMSETYGCCGWDVTPRELKQIAEFQYVYGVNLMCQHLLPYSEHGQRKRDYPAHFSEVNPWVKKNFKEFNDYFSVLGKLLAESTEVVNVGVLHPIRSTYFDYKRNLDKSGWGVSEIDEGLHEISEYLANLHIPFHFIDETILAKYGKVEGSRLIVGNCAYDYWIFPKIYTMDKTTEKLLREYVNAGGKAAFAGGKPTYLEGEEYSYDYLDFNVTPREIANAQEYYVVRGENLRSTLRKDENGRYFLYVINLGKEKTAKFLLKNGKSFLAYDIMKDEYIPMSTEVHFDEWQSYILYFSDEEVEKKGKTLKPLKLGEKFTVCGNAENYLTLDFIRYSFDGETYSERLHHMGVFDEMLKKRYAGKLYLKYEFEVDEIPERCSLLAENTNTVWVKVNEERVEKTGVSEVESQLFAYDLAGKLRKGKNEVVILIDYFQSEQVYYALFGENVTESLKNCLVYDTDIEAVYIKGDFGVYGDFTQGRAKDILLGENFRIGKKKTEITSLIEEGYPFFSGNITLKQTLTVDDTQRELVIDKRFHLIDVKVNGEYIGRMMFDTAIDVSKALKVGENEIELVVTVGNRNLLGPFHTPDQEDLGVSPYTFERSGQWKDGKCENLRESYAFLKTIV